MGAVIDDMWAGKAKNTWDIPTEPEATDPKLINVENLAYDSVELLATPRIRQNNETKQRKFSPSSNGRYTPRNQLYEILTEASSSKPTRDSCELRSSVESVSTSRARTNLPSPLHSRSLKKQLSDFNYIQSPTFSFAKTTRFSSSRNISPGPGRYSS